MTRVAWCTGAGKGIGRAVVLELARQGWVIAASSRTVADLQSLAAEAQRSAGIVEAFPVDIGDEAAVASTVAAIEERLGPIDLAILNAGTHIPVSVAGFSSRPFRDLMETNFMGTVYGLCAVIPRFVARRSGHVCVVASVSGYRGLPTAGAYGASKAALINLCEALKPELDRAGVPISLVNPGFVKTPLTDKNTFKMPFLIDAETAARRIVAGLAAGRFEITFPRRFTWGLKVLRCLPYALYFALTRTMVRS